MSLNKCRRKQLECNKVDYDKANKLQKVLETSPKYEGTVFRGTTFSSKESLDAHLEKAKKGKIFEDNGFMSTSIKRGTADLFDFGDGYGVRYEIKSKNGVAIREHSKAKGEQEILFPAKSKFFVKNIKKIGSVYIINLENID